MSTPINNTPKGVGENVVNQSPEVLSDLEQRLSQLEQEKSELEDQLRMREEVMQSLFSYIAAHPKEK